MIRTPRSGRLGAQPLQLSPTHPGKPWKFGGEPACCPQMGRALHCNSYTCSSVYSYPVYRVKKYWSRIGEDRSVGHFTVRVTSSACCSKCYLTLDWFAMILFSTFSVSPVCKLACIYTAFHNFTNVRVQVFLRSCSYLDVSNVFRSSCFSPAEVQRDPRLRCGQLCWSYRLQTPG